METVSKIRKFHTEIERPSKNQIFVFGSNLSGRHGAAAAQYALRYCGAEYGLGIGLQGQSYAIPTKDKAIQTLPLDSIVPYIQAFKQFTLDQPQREFFVTRIGCGLAGYTDEEIAPWFTGCSYNCVFPEEWEPYLFYDRLKALYSEYIS